LCIFLHKLKGYFAVSLVVIIQLLIAEEVGIMRRIQILKIMEVMEILRMGRATIYDRLDKKSPRYDPTFPRPLKLGRNSIGWADVSIYEWLEVKMEEREC